jgi:hypothetical protein
MAESSETQTKQGVFAVPVEPEQPPAEWGGTWEAYYELRRQFPQKRAQIPWEVVEPYQGMMVAWTPDAARIIDADKDYAELWNRMVARGEYPLLFVFEPIPGPEDQGWV